MKKTTLFLLLFAIAVLALTASGCNSFSRHETIIEKIETMPFDRVPFAMYIVCVQGRNFGEKNSGYDPRQCDKSEAMMLDIVKKKINNPVPSVPRKRGEIRKDQSGKPGNN